MNIFFSVEENETVTSNSSQSIIACCVNRRRSTAATAVFCRVYFFSEVWRKNAHFYAVVVVVEAVEGKSNSSILVWDDDKECKKKLGCDRNRGFQDVVHIIRWQCGKWKEQEKG